MAVNLPINLMSKAAPPLQSQHLSGPSETGVTAVQPTAASAATRDASSGDTNGQGSSQQQALTAKRPVPPPPSQATPDNADAKSVVTAQTQNAPDDGLAAARRFAEANQQSARTEALIQSISVAPKAPALVAEKKETDAPKAQASELDRFAPPDPLPTAPILKAADSYKGASNRN